MIRWNVKRRMAVFSVTKELLVELLHLPEGTTIVGIFDQPWEPVLLVYVENPAFPELAPGEMPTHCCPSYRKTHALTTPRCDGDVTTVIRQCHIVEFVDWNVEPKEKEGG